MNHDTLVEEINARQSKKGQDSMADEINSLRAAVAERDARIKALEDGLRDAARFIDDLANDDLNDIAADGGLTVGLAFQMEAKTVYGPRARSLLPPAQGETQ